MYQFQKYSSRACQITHILKFFGLRQNLTLQNFFFKIQNLMREKIVAGAINYLSIKILTKKKIQDSKSLTSKIGRVWNQKKIKTLSAQSLLKIKLVPQFRQFLNVWHIQNLEQPFLIWACNCLVKFWRSPKNFKIQKFLWKIFNRLSKKNSPRKNFGFWNFWTSSKFDEAIAGPNQKRLLQILDMSYI